MLVYEVKNVMMTNLPLKNEKGIEDAALAQIAAMFQRPSQLEKLDELRKRAERKKVEVAI